MSLINRTMIKPKNAEKKYDNDLRSPRKRFNTVHNRNNNAGDKEYVDIVGWGFMHEPPEITAGIPREV